jgi:CRISPR-associated protein Cmr6
VRWAGEGDSWSFEVGKEVRKRANHDRAAEAFKSKEIRDLAEAWRRRRGGWLAPLEKDGRAKRFRARTDWRLVVGLAGPSPLETNLTLHQLYGVPYLPGSGLKGLARSAARADLRVDEKNEPDEVAEAFGTPKGAGLVDVLDGIPIYSDERPLVTVDVMNSHYPDWYRDGGKGGVKPADNQNPNPVFFLTVAPKSEFEFAVLCRRRISDARTALGRVEKWLCAGLRDLGAGGKTAAGYGYFDIGLDA